MQAERVVLASPLERRELRAAVVEIVLGVDLEPRDRRARARPVRRDAPSADRSRLAPGSVRQDTYCANVSASPDYLLGASVLPPALAQSSFDMCFHSFGSLSFFAWPAHE